MRIQLIYRTLKRQLLQILKHHTALHKLHYWRINSNSYEKIRIPTESMTDGMRALKSGLDQWQQKVLELKSSKPFK